MHDTTARVSFIRESDKRNYNIRIKMIKVGRTNQFKYKTTWNKFMKFIGQDELFCTYNMINIDPMSMKWLNQSNLKHVGE